MVIISLYAMKLKWSSVFALGLTSLSLIGIWKEKQLYLEKKENLQKNNKDYYLMAFQKFFIENFTSTFSLKGNYDEGFGILYSYLQIRDRTELEANYFFLQKVIMDFNTYIPFQILSILCYGYPASFLIVIYYYTFYKMKLDFNKNFKEKKFFDISRYLNQSEFFNYNELSGKAMIGLGLFSLVSLFRKK